MTIELTLPTMTCGHCVRTVTATVQQVDADAKLQIDLPTHRVQIEPHQADAQTLRSAIEAAGYTPVAVGG